MTYAPITHGRKESKKRLWSRRSAHCLWGIAFICSVALALLAVVPQAAAQADAQLFGPVTHEAIWLWEAPTPAATLLLAGASTQPDDTTPLVAVVWSEDRSGWFPTQQIQLLIPGDTGEPEVHTLLRSSLQTAQQLEVRLSIHPEAGVVSVAVHDPAAPQPLALHAVRTRLPEGPWYPALLSASSGPQLTSSNFSSHYQPVATRFDVGQRTETFTFLPLNTFEAGDVATVRIDSIVAPPGTYRMKAVSRSAEGTDLVFATELTPEGRDWIELPLERFPLGESELILEYVEDGEVTWDQRRAIRVGMVELFVKELNPEYDRGVLTAQLWTVAETELPSVRATVKVRYTELAWDAASQAHVPTAEAAEHTVAVEDIDSLHDRSPYLLEMPLPPHEGVWQVDFEVATEPQIHVTLSGRQDILAYNPGATDYLIAVTDQASGRILVLDPTVTDWNNPVAVRWSWSPANVSGFSVGWGLPSGVKLRRSEVWGGEWMLVVDSRGMAAIVPYPEGDRYQWFHVIDGNLHSAELLPDGNIALAASTGGWVRIYTSSQGATSGYYVEYPLPGAHGVLWDPTSELLWAVGDHHLVGLRVFGPPEAPRLERVVQSALPTPWGHDLSPVYGDPDRLWVSTNTRVYQYIKSTDTWTTQFAGGGQLNLPYVKGVGNQPSGRVALTQQKAGSLYTWTTDTVTLLNPYATRTIDGAAFYKARIWSPEYQ